ncbi:high-temperature-induced dauer-formation protein-domain-containing protein [Hysterangium stoloniferum]|nr:high-temperature-induced dauer-formation protein-domain-containing protein [Hysterangium stoloniferum]
MFRLPSLSSVNVPGLSSDPKLAFRNAPNGLIRLSRNAIPADETSYWKQYWELFDSVEEVNTIITPQHIRTALPENIRVLVTVLVNHFIRLIRSQTFPRPVSATFQLKISSWGGSFVPDDVRAVLNCARVIARVLPLLWEEDADWLWQGVQQEAAESNVVSESDGQGQFVIDDEDDDDPAGSSNTAPQSASTSNPPTNPSPSLMAQFLDALIDGLFHIGFTLPDDAASEPSQRTSYLIWTSGIGSSSSPGFSSPILINRSTLLLTLLTALSHSLYATPLSLRHQTSDPVLSHLCALPRKAYLALLCSLLNTTLTPPQARIIGLVARDEDLYPQRAAQVLLVMLSQPQIFEGIEKSNVLQRAVAKLHRPQDFDFVIEGIKSALDADLARSGIVNGVTKAVPVGRRGNGPGALEKFVPHLLSSTSLPAILTHLFATMTTFKSSPPHFALLRTLSYLLQTLSSFRAFTLALSPKPLSAGATNQPTADMLITALYALITAQKELYQPLLVTLVNTAPYVKGLSVQSAGKLVALFGAFSGSGFLLAEEGNPRYNLNVVYALLRSHERLQFLANFTLSSGLAEIKRLKAKREEHLRRKTTGAGVNKDQKAPTNESPDSSSPPAEEEQVAISATTEKDRVKDREDVLAASAATLSTDPSTEEASTPSPFVPTTYPPPLSEKARGKLRARSPSLDGSDSAILGYTSYESASGFVATEEWVESWRKGLPMDSVLLAVTELLPLIQPSSPPSVALLASTTLVGILPPPPAIISRRFQWTERSEVWRASLLWGEIYVTSGPVQGPWGGTGIRLFGIKQAPLTRRDQAIANVTSAVGNMWSAVGGGRTGQPGTGSPRSSRDGGEGGAGRRR